MKSNKERVGSILDKYMLWVSTPPFVCPEFCISVVHRYVSGLEDLTRRLVLQRLMRPFVVVEVKVNAKSNPGLANAFVGFQVYLLLFHPPP